MTRGWHSLLLLALAFGLALASHRPSVGHAHAAAILTVVSPADSGPGTLRWALQEAAPGDTVAFDPAVFPPESPTVIQVVTALPPLDAGAVTLDASRSGVILDGSLAPADTPGITLASDGNAILGLTIRRFGGPGLRILGAANRLLDNKFYGNGGDGVLLEGAAAASNLLLRNFIGVTPSGTPAGNGGHGVHLTAGAQDNLVGHTRSDANVIGGNGGDGVHLEGTTTEGNLVRGNFLGTDRTGHAGLGNGGCGVRVQGAAENHIGGAGPGEGNIVAGNQEGGICLAGGARHNEVTANHVGTTLSGLTALPNLGPGILLEGGASSNTLQANLVAGNQGPGLHLRGAGTDANLILGNRVGVNAVGAAALPNAGAGILAEAGAAYNILGRVADGEANQVSGNAGPGIWLRGEGTRGNVAAGNLVGTDFGGYQPLGNGEDGVRLSDGARENVILANVVAGNDGNGVQLRGAGTADNLVAANLVGWDRAAGSPLPNAGHGVHILEGAAGNHIGQAAPLAALRMAGLGARAQSLDWGNGIAHNLGDGVRVAGTGRVGNALRRNRITANGGRGIHLADGGNRDLAAPVLQEVGRQRVAGTACAGCWVEVFADPADEGGTLLGTAQADQDGQFTFAGPVTGPYVTATATDAEGNTSPFAEPRALGGYLTLPLALANW